MFFAHSLEGQEELSNGQRLKVHLENVAALASSYAKEFGAENAATAAGLLHDLGKYTAKFQARLLGDQEKVDHSTAGAKEILNYAKSSTDRITADLIAYVIAGHHAGLTDRGDLNDRLKKEIEPVDEVWKNEINTDFRTFWPNFAHLSKDRDIASFQLGFFGRMLFSCVVDADYKDTEAFYVQHGSRSVDRIWPDLQFGIDELISQFNAFMERLKGRGGPLDILRTEILHHIRGNAKRDQGFFTLTVPTGGGKTLASLAFALDHAKAHNLGRIIYAIPFTSIIEQNAAIFRKVLGDEYILEHHASIENNNEDPELSEKLRLATEDWAAPVVVTTNVQLFESLFSNRSSRCRKLHNLANSIIILDEVQALPLNLLRPSLAVLDELTKHYGVTVVLCTATQPAFDKRDFGQGGLDLAGRELAPDPDNLFQNFKRVTINKEKELDNAQIINALQDSPQALVIVNSRKHALELYRSAKEEGLESLVHLTTRQCAEDRRNILKDVRKRLEENRPCRLIATSLVEAGVDIDFPSVWRAEAGLDQIAQAAGRCNRENKRSWQESVVTVFKPKDYPPPREIAQLASAFAAMKEKHEDLLSPAAIKDYFSEVFWQKGIERLDNKEILKLYSISGGHPSCDYKETAKRFRMIESGLQPTIIKTPKSELILGRLANPNASPGKAARELQPFVVQIPPKDFESLCKNNRAAYHRSDLWGDQFAVLMDNSLYTYEMGLIWEDADILQDTIF